ncbi:MAG: hypothetical protein JST59_00880 [Actinobacteria bacterium]|nr:hypothetical protein [Actinomycetota bacterium]
MKVQTILRCLRTDELLMGLVRSHILEISLEDLHTTFSVLIVFADDNLVNCQSLLDLLSQVELHFEGEDEMEELYALVRVIVKNPLMR